jgi:lipopolysaccharide export system permease protein
MFAMGSLAKNSELTAMKGAGISILQLTWPLLALGVGLAAASFYAGEMVLPTANYHRRELRENLADDRAVARTGAARAHRELRRDFYYLADKRTMYHFEEFRTFPTGTRNVWQLQFDGHRIAHRVQAASLEWRAGAWSFVSGSTRQFHADTALVTAFDTLADTLLRATPEEMVVRIKGKEEMSYWELADYIDKVRRQGEKVWMHMADLYFKIAYPAMNCIVLLLGVAITARAGRKGSAVLFGVGLLITFAYWIIAQFALAFAHTGQLSPLAGAWSANMVFAALGLVLYRRALR